jgi:hypothetical protein
MDFVEELLWDDARRILFDPVVQPIVHAAVVRQKVELNLTLGDEKAFILNQSQLSSGETNSVNIFLLIPFTDCFDPAFPPNLSSRILWLWMQIQQRAPDC